VGASLKRTVLALGLLAAAALRGCGDDQPLWFDEALPLVWVDPARCLSDCAHADEPALVAIDASGVANPAGGLQLRREAQPALQAMLRAAAGASFSVTVGSAHRTYAEQAALWDQYSVSEPGRSARPGHSEHEAGLAVDLNFDSDGAAAWIAANAWRFGFAQSYPQHAQRATGFRFESWHFRFVGSAIAAELHGGASPTLEQLFESRPGLGVSGDCHDCPLESSRGTCADVTVAGACDGAVLTWCFDGAAAAVDCTTSGLACAVDPSSLVATCVDP
jgi:hypothetical protein